MQQYLVVIEQTDTGYSAYSPDIPGCVATGRSKDEAAVNMQEAVEFHLEGMRADGMPLPSPTSVAAYVNVAA